MVIIDKNWFTGNPFRKLWIHFLSDSLFRNSIYLMLATAVMSGFGFFFWMINAKIFITEEIGLATALISIMSLIAVFSLAGFNTTFVRYLPNSANPNDKLNTGMVVVGITALILSSLFAAFIKVVSPNLDFIVSSPLVAFSFIFFCVMSALNILTDSVFLASRRAKYTLIINTIFSAIKMVLPFAFIGWGALGIFMAAALAQTIGFILSVSVMIWKFDFRPRLVIKMDVIKKVWRFSASNYVAGVFNMTPVSLLPVIIINHLGAEASAYFYISMMIGNLLYVVPLSITNSLFAEGSNNESSINTNTKKAIKIIATLTIPGILVLFFASGTILRIFGKNYDSGGIDFLRLIAIAAIAISAYRIFNSVFAVGKKLHSIMFINALFAVTTILLSYALLPFGLVGIGFAWLGGNSITGIAGFLLYYKSRNSERVIKEEKYEMV
jgi:O-antigen/teichoic acid export membrane protein